MPSTEVPASIPPTLRRLGIAVDRALLGRLDCFLDLLLEANRRLNLTGLRDKGIAWHRHLLDSLTLLPHLRGASPGTRIVDVGAGGGLPSMPLALCRPDLHFRLLEATAKKVRFLEQCTARLGLKNVTPLHLRAENAGRDPAFREQHEVALCRAVGPLREILEYTLPLLKKDGRLLAMKGARAQEEVAAATTALSRLGGGRTDVIPTALESGVVVVVTKLRATPDTYPRLPGRARKKPL